MTNYEKYVKETVRCKMADGETELFNARFTQSLIRTDFELYVCKEKLAKLKDKYKLLKVENERLKKLSTK